MQWVEITIVTNEDASDAICEMLAQVGADGIAVNDPFEIKREIDDPDSLSYADEGYIDSLGTDVTIRAYFAEFDDGIRLGAKSEEYIDPNGVGNIYGNITNKTCPRDEALDILKQKLSFIDEFLPVGKGLTEWKYVKDEDWANEWKKDYKSFKISDRVMICPSWEKPETDEASVVVMLDPGSAFGTGTHETTSMCAQLLDEIVIPEDKILDLGTGSGILSIIASKLGAGSVEAIDIDRLAVDVAVDNCEKNDCGSIVCHAGELKDAYASDYSLIVANIIADVICMIAADIPSHLCKGGRFLCSGIINTKSARVEEALLNAGLKIIEKREKNDWMAYLCEVAE